MTDSPTWTYDGVTQQVWDCLLSRASGMGFTVPPGNSGIVSSREVAVRYERDPAASVLSLTVVQKPREITSVELELALTGAVRQCGGR